MSELENGIAWMIAGGRRSDEPADLADGAGRGRGAVSAAAAILRRLAAALRTRRTRRAGRLYRPL